MRVGIHGGKVERRVPKAGNLRRNAVRSLPECGRRLPSGARTICRISTIIIGLADAAVCGFVLFEELTSRSELPPGLDIVFGYFVLAPFLMTGVPALALAAFGWAPSVTASV